MHQSLAFGTISVKKLVFELKVGIFNWDLKPILGIFNVYHIANKFMVAGDREMQRLYCITNVGNNSDLFVHKRIYHVTWKSRIPEFVEIEAK
jgi:hypothetical protein